MSDHAICRESNSAVKTPFISVITVVWNDLSGLKSTYASLLRQDFGDFEWIVVDGKSTDGCVDFLRSVDAVAITWMSERDNGIFDAMNKGTTLAKGAYVIYLNASDGFDGPQSLRAIAEALKSDPLDLLCCGACYTAGKRRHQRPPRLIEKSIWHTVPSVHQAMIFRRSFLDDVPYDIAFSVSADYYATAKSFLKGGRVGYLKSSVVYYALGGFSSRHKWCAIKEAFFIQRQILSQSLFLCLASCMRRLVSQLLINLSVWVAKCGFVLILAWLWHVIIPLSDIVP
jgi:putative colanic acid biosynthesis glycosyltransferase